MGSRRALDGSARIAVGSVGVLGLVTPSSFHASGCFAADRLAAGVQGSSPSNPVGFVVHVADRKLASTVPGHGTGRTSRC